MKRAVALLAAAGVAAMAGWWFLGERDRSDGVVRSAVGPESIVMLGDSITAGTDWQQRFPEREMVNEGYPGYTTRQLVPVARDVADRSPRVVFVLTGTNDVRDGLGPAETVAALSELLDRFEQRSTRSRVVVQTILPRAATADEIIATNAAISELAVERGLELLDLHAVFDDGDGGLRPEHTTDGWHLSRAGYDRWADALATVMP